MTHDDEAENAAFEAWTEEWSADRFVRAALGGDRPPRLREAFNAGRSLLIARIAELEAKLADHNANCVAACDTNRRRNQDFCVSHVFRCPKCPRHDMIEVSP